MTYITVSSSINEQYNSTHGRQYTIAGNIGGGAWAPAFLDQNPWIKADLGALKVVIGVVTQGAGGGIPSWVTSYKVDHSIDGITFQSVLNENGDVKFIGNTDSNTEVKNIFNSTIYAQFIRIIQIEHNGYSTGDLKFELLGPCSGSQCHSVLEGENSTIQLSTSSDRPTNKAHCGRLNKISYDDTCRVWVPPYTDQNPWIQADLGAVKAVIGVVTQGYRFDWVESYTILHSVNGSNFQSVLNRDGEIVFNGNTEGNTMVTNIFYSTIYARFVRINLIDSGDALLLGIRFEPLGTCSENLERSTVEASQQDTSNTNHRLSDVFNVINEIIRSLMPMMGNLTANEKVQFNTTNGIGVLSKQTASNSQAIKLNINTQSGITLVSTGVGEVGNETFVILVLIQNNNHMESYQEIEGNRLKIASEIITINLYTEQLRDVMPEWTDFTTTLLINKSTAEPNTIPGCYFIAGKESTRLWQNTGCHTYNNDVVNEVRCICTHLTSFAILMQTQDVIEVHSVEILTYICISTSSFFLSITLVVICCLKYVLNCSK